MNPLSMANIYLHMLDKAVNRECGFFYNNSTTEKMLEDSPFCSSYSLTKKIKKIDIYLVMMIRFSKGRCLL